MNYQKYENIKSYWLKTRFINCLYLVILIIYLILNQASGASWKGNLFPTFYNWDFKTLITAENNRLENPNNAPPQNKTSGMIFYLI